MNLTHASDVHHRKPPVSNKFSSLSRFIVLSITQARPALLLIHPCFVTTLSCLSSHALHGYIHVDVVWVCHLHASKEKNQKCNTAGVAEEIIIKKKTAVAQIL